MATYTPEQLYGAGTLGENLSGTKTFTFNNPGNSSYFVLETTKDNNGTFTNRPACAEGTWVASASMGLVQSPFVVGVVIQPGVSSLEYTPASSITGTDYYLRGTGQFTLTIS